MLVKIKKKFAYYLIVVILTFIFATSYAYIFSFYCQKHISVVEIDADVIISVEVLSDKILNDSNFHKELTNKIIQVENINHYSIKKFDSITLISVPYNNKLVLSFYFDKSQISNKNTLKRTSMSIKGIYKGYMPYDSNFHIPGEIKISNSIITKSNSILS